MIILNLITHSAEYIGWPIKWTHPTLFIIPVELMLTHDTSTVGAVLIQWGKGLGYCGESVLSKPLQYCLGHSIIISGGQKKRFELWQLISLERSSWGHSKLARDIFRKLYTSYKNLSVIAYKPL